jgi:outer membrane protein assembly factor BamB
MGVTIAAGATLAVICIAGAAAQERSEIVINDTREFPESVTSSRDGTVFFGSQDKGIIYRAAPGASRADPWVQPAAVGLQSVFGVLADDDSSTLWVCSTGPTPPGPPPGISDASLKALDLRSGVLKRSYPLPGGGTCSDIAVARDGTAYVSEMKGGRVLRLKKGATALEVWSTDPLLASADGLALLSDGALYVNGWRTGVLVRIEVNRDGSARPVVKLETSRPLGRPDGMRAVNNGNALLLAEGDGRLDEVTINGNTATVKVLKEGLEWPAAVTMVGDTAFVLEAKFTYRNDPALRERDPGPFHVLAVPYRVPK